MQRPCRTTHWADCGLAAIVPSEKQLTSQLCAYKGVCPSQGIINMHLPSWSHTDGCTAHSWLLTDGAAVTQATVLLRVDLLHAAAEARLKAQGAEPTAGAGGKAGRSPARRKATAAGAQQLKLNVRLSLPVRCLCPEPPTLVHGDSSGMSGQCCCHWKPEAFD